LGILISAILAADSLLSSAVFYPVTALHKFNFMLVITPNKRERIKKQKQRGTLHSTYVPLIQQVLVKMASIRDCPIQRQTFKSITC
jgi:hypothetical protein